MQTYSTGAGFFPRGNTHNRVLGAPSVARHRTRRASGRPRGAGVAVAAGLAAPHPPALRAPSATTAPSLWHTQIARVHGSGALLRGSSGTVERVWDAARGQFVAVKRIVFTNDREHAQALLEIAIQERIDHPSIPTLRAARIESRRGDQPPKVLQGVAYLVMDWVWGKSLAEHRQIGLAQALQFVAAVAHLQRLGITHNDVHAENMMLGPGGIALIDFGMAQWSSNDTSTQHDWQRLLTTLLPRLALADRQVLRTYLSERNISVTHRPPYPAVFGSCAGAQTPVRQRRARFL